MADEKRNDDLPSYPQDHDAGAFGALEEAAPGEGKRRAAVEERFDPA